MVKMQSDYRTNYVDLIVVYSLLQHAIKGKVYLKENWISHKHLPKYIICNFYLILFS